MVPKSNSPDEIRSGHPAFHPVIQVEYYRNSYDDTVSGHLPPHTTLIIQTALFVIYIFNLKHTHLLTYYFSLGHYKQNGLPWAPPWSQCKPSSSPLRLQLVLKGHNVVQTKASIICSSECVYVPNMV